MQKLLFTFGLLFTLNMGYSQTSDFNKNEVFLGLVSVVKSPTYKENPIYMVRALQNIGYKRFLTPKHALIATLFRPVIDSYDNSSDLWINKGSYKEFQAKIGYEYHFFQKALSPYLGVDLMYQHSSSSNETAGGFTGGSNKITHRANGLGLTPKLGLNYKVHKNIALGLETNLIFLFSHDKSITESTLISGHPSNTSTSSSNDFNYILAPVQLFAKVSF